MKNLQHLNFFSLIHNRVWVIEVNMDFITHTECLTFRTDELECTGVVIWNLECKWQLKLACRHLISSEFEKSFVKFEKQKGIVLSFVTYLLLLASLLCHWYEWNLFLCY